MSKKLWLDDERRPPNRSWIWVRTIEDAMTLLRYGGVTEISLDHDLGVDPVTGDLRRDGSEVAYWIEDRAYHGLLGPMKIRCHSANPVGRERIERAIERAEWSWGARSSIGWAWPTGKVR